jgi:glucoamylase
MMGRLLAGAVMAAAALCCASTASAASLPRPEGSSPLGSASAPDGPGAMSHFDLARKDCVGTARNTRSKVWFTVADGVLSDVFYPPTTRPTARRCSTP